MCKHGSSWLLAGTDRVSWEPLHWAVGLPLLIRMVCCWPLLWESAPFQTHLRPWHNRQDAWILPHPWWALPPCVASAGRSAVKQRFTGRWGCVLVLWFSEVCSLVPQLPILRRNIVSPSSGLKSWESLPVFRIKTAYWVTSGFGRDVMRSTFFWDFTQCRIIPYGSFGTTCQAIYKGQAVHLLGLLDPWRWDR